MSDVIYDSANRRFAWPRIASEPVFALAMHWSTLAKNGRPPLRERFTPLDLPARDWKNLYLLDVGPQSGEFRLRVHGTYLVDAAGTDCTGRRLNEDEIPGCTRTALYRMLPRAVSPGLPQYHKGETLFRMPDWKRGVEQVMCPLADEHGRIVSIIGAVEFAPMAKSVELADA